MSIDTAAAAPDPPAWQRVVLGRRPVRTLARITVVIAVAVVVFTFVLLPVRGVGVSMDPTIRPGEFVLVSLLTYRWRAPARGDIVAVRLAGRRAVYVKRLVALPGERLAMRGGQMMINGERLDEPYVIARQAWNLDETELGPDEYFVVGDNRGMPMALHTMGTTSRARLLGPVIF
ncbi:MAG: signal peptidase I [Vicinamibacterales bacterium]|nr:signal peptidase I [Vicinamibacterales bacterium]